MAVSEENYKNISYDTGQDKNEGQSVQRIPISVLTLDEIKLNDNLYGELQYLFSHLTR